MTVMCASSFFVKVVKGEENSKIANPAAAGVSRSADNLYNKIDFGDEAPLSREVFSKAYTGYLNLKEAGRLGENRDLLSVCDFSLSANVKRLWVIDLKARKVLFHTLVAHGQGTGEEFAENFSNLENSHQSSMGFYVTAGTYNGDNGYSLRLNGMDNGYNDAAFNRAIVVHGADYVCDSYIRSNKRLGRSWGCPAVPAAQAKPIIDAIRDNTCLFIYFPSRRYLAQSVWLNKTPTVIMGDSLLREEYNKMQKTAKSPQMLASAAKPGAADSGSAGPVTPEQNSYQGVRLAVGN